MVGKRNNDLQPKSDVVDKAVRKRVAKAVVTDVVDTTVDTTVRNLAYERLKKSRVQQYCHQVLKNWIIEWKRENTKQKDDNNQDYYDRFLNDVCPENIKINDGKVTWRDPRCQGKEWKGLFQKMTAEDEIVDPGEPPS